MLKKENARDILFKSNLDESQISVARKLAHASKGLRQGYIRGDPESVEGNCAAAIEIQRVWRGYRTRTGLYDVIQPKVSTTAVYSGSKHHFTRQEDFLGYDKDGKEKPAGRVRLESYYSDFMQRLIDSGLESSKIPPFEDYCANFIQDWWRDLQEKRNLAQKPPPVEQSIPVKKPVRIPTPREAACMIQRAWRRHIDIQVYRYYRDLINFKTRGNPSMMLKCINPNEAKYLDPAAGIHIKFRLAGERFPPNIYYKIFTHRPIQDMCSNSPKDYTKAEVKLKMARDQHNLSKARTALGEDDHSGWYRREDNNGWRLVSDRLIPHIMADTVTWESSQKKYEYHHDKLQRKQDVEKRKKKKKIQWMQKMYRDGMLKAKSDDKETIQLIEGAAAGMVATVENYGFDALEDWEVDELLDWTTSLNFEDYQNSWKELATSANSEKQIEDRLRLLTSTADPYELTLSTGPSRYQSTQQSRNTPASGTSSPGGVGRGQVVVS